MIKKHRDQRDLKEDGTPYSDEEIAERLQVILGISRKAVPRDRSPVMDDAAAALTRGINRWLLGEGENPPVNYRNNSKTSPPTVDPPIARQWLEAVLAAWKAYLLAQLPTRIHLQLEKLFKNAKGDLL